MVRVGVREVRNCNNAELLNPINTEGLGAPQYHGGGGGSARVGEGATTDWRVGWNLDGAAKRGADGALGNAGAYYRDSAHYGLRSDCPILLSKALFSSMSSRKPSLAANKETPISAIDRGEYCFCFINSVTRWPCSN